MMEYLFQSILSNEYTKKCFTLTFKSLCTFYVWNQNIYCNIKRLFEKNNYVEPFEPYWTNYITMIFDDNDKYVNNDLYNFHNSLSGEDLIVEYNKYYKSFEKTKKNVEKLFVSKYENIFVFRTWNYNKPHVQLNEINKKSGVSLLLVEYSHPCMIDTIELEIPDNYMYIGNEILSCSFVLRLLEKQGKPYIFDNEYVIYCLDNNMLRIKLTMHDYLILQEDNYIIDTNLCIKEHILNDIYKEIELSEEAFWSSPHRELANYFSDFLKMLSIILMIDVKTHNTIKELEDNISQEDLTEDEESLPDLTEDEESLPDLTDDGESLPDLTDDEESLPDLIEDNISQEDLTEYEESQPDLIDNEESQEILLDSRSIYSDNDIGYEMLTY